MKSPGVCAVLRPDSPLMLFDPEWCVYVPGLVEHLNLAPFVRREFPVHGTVGEVELCRRPRTDKSRFILGSQKLPHDIFEMVIVLPYPVTWSVNYSKFLVSA